MKLTTTFALAAAALLAIPALTRAADQPAAKTGNLAATTVSGPNDVKVLAELQHANVMEIQMGKLAKSNASSEAIKNFGDKLVADHTSAQEKTEEVAKQLGVKLPAESDTLAGKDHDAMAKLQALQGPSFDIAFARAMANDHAKAVTKFEGDQKYVTGPTAALLTEVLPVLKEHAKIANQLVLNPNGATGTQKTN